MLAPFGRAGVRLIDRILEWFYPIEILSTAPDCLLRIARGRGRRDLVLADGARIRHGDAVLALHFWNERLSPHDRLDGRRGVVLLRSTRASLGYLAQALQNDAYRDVRAVWAEIGFVPDTSQAQVRRLARLFGFELMPGERPGWNPLRAAFWQNVFSWWMMWTYNPTSLRKASFPQLRRCEIWISREQVLARYGRDCLPATDGHVAAPATALLPD